jgi:hypothetical protein
MLRTLSIRSIRFSSLLGAALLTLTGASAMAASQTTQPTHLIHHGKANRAALVAKAEPSATSASSGAVATSTAAAASPADPASVKAAAKGDHKARKTAAKSASHMKEKAAVVAPEGSAIPAAPAPAAEKGSPKGTEKAGAESSIEKK